MNCRFDTVTAERVDLPPGRRHREKRVTVARFGRVGTMSLLALCAGVAMGTGCFQVDGAWDDAPDVLGPEVVGTRLVFGERQRDSLLVVQVDSGRLGAIERIPLPGNPTTLRALPSGDGIVVLQSSAQTLSVVRFDGGPTKHWPLGAGFSGVALSPEANAALLYFRPGTGDDVFSNNNQLAFVDFAQADGVEPARRSLASLGGAPESFHVSPAVAGRRFGFILSTNHVAVVDLLAPNSAERSVPLVSLVSGGLRNPEDVAFGVEADALWGVITTTGGESAFALKVTPTLVVDDGAPFDVRLNQIAGVASGAPVAMATGNDGGLRALLINPLTGVMTITDLDTASSQTVELGAGMNRIERFDVDGQPHALVYAPGRKVFHVVDLEGVIANKVKAVRTRHAHRGVERVIPVSGTALFGAVHDGEDESFSIIDTVADRVTPFLRTGAIQDVHLDDARGQVILLTRRSASGAANGQAQAYVVSVALDGFSPQTATVLGAGDRLLVMAEADTVAVVGSQGAGALELWPTGSTLDESALRIPNLFAHGLASPAENAP